MSVYQHFREDEKPFIDLVLEWKDQVLEKYMIKRTDFLDPRQQDILNSLIGKDEDMNCSVYGGTSTCERKRAILYPLYQDIKASDYQLTYFDVAYPKKFATITHRDLLGALMSLGLKREKFGDIILTGDRIQLIVASEIADFTRLHLTSVGKTPVELNEIDVKELMNGNNTWLENEGTVSSLRLDTILSEIYNQSRSKVNQWIESGFVKVNWKLVEKPSYDLQAGDYLSLRGFGRSKIIRFAGETKKGKIRIHYGILK